MLQRHRVVSIGLIAQFMQYGAGLVLLPFVISRLSEAEVAIWYVFVTVQGLVLLVDFGFQPTIGRAFASAYAGVQQLQRQGLSEATGDKPNLMLVASVVHTARRLYLGLAATVLLILTTAGTAYITSIARGEVGDITQVQIAWILSAIGTAANLYFLWILPLLIGSGYVAQNYMLTIVNRGGFALMGTLVLLAGGGLIGLAAANLTAVVLGRIVASIVLRPVLRPLGDMADVAANARSVLIEMWPNAWRMGLVALGAFAINRSNMLILSSFLDLSQAARYAISLQLLGAVAAVSQLPTQAVLPQLVALQVRNDRAALRRMVLGRQAFMFITFVLGAGAILLVGQPLLELASSNVRLIDPVPLALLALVLLLEANHSNCAIIITTANRVPFVWPGLISGFGVVALSIILVINGAGILGIILAQGFVQLVYNNWKWPLMLWKELRV